MQRGDLFGQLAQIFQLWLMKFLTYGSRSCNAMVALVWINDLLKRSSWFHGEGTGSEGRRSCVLLPKRGRRNGCKQQWC